MDQKTHLNQDKAGDVAAAFSEGLRCISPEWVERQRIVRQLLAPDPLERMVPEKLLFEAVATHMHGRTLSRVPLVVMMNRSGHGDGARIANGLFPILSEAWRGLSLIHVSFSTPARGLGALVRGLLVKAGVEHDIDVHVVAHNRPVEGLRLSGNDVSSLLDPADFVISFASGGGAGLLGANTLFEPDPLLARSHVAILSYPDPEGLIGELDSFDQVLGREPNLAALRFRVQVLKDDRTFEDFGTAALGEGGDAKTRLWSLIDNARRQVYRVLLQPLSGGGGPKGAPLVYPCRALIESSLAASAAVVKIVPVGARLVAVAKGNMTLN